MQGNKLVLPCDKLKDKDMTLQIELEHKDLNYFVEFDVDLQVSSGTYDTPEYIDWSYTLWYVTATDEDGNETELDEANLPKELAHRIDEAIDLEVTRELERL